MNYAEITEVVNLASLSFTLTKQLSPFIFGSTTFLASLPSVACSSYLESTLFSFQGANRVVTADASGLLRPDRNTQTFA